MKKKKRKSKLQKKYVIRRVLFGAGLIFVLMSPIILVFNISNSSKKKNNDGSMVIKNNFGVEVYNDDLQEIYEKLSVIKTDFKWDGELEEGNDPKKIFLHHSAKKNINVQDIHKTHIERGWAGIGYHYFINKEGKIYKGREDNIIGAHVKKNNENSLGICLEGNFEKEQIEQKQSDALNSLLIYLSLKYDIKELLGHRDEGQTLCPGENIKITSIQKVLITSIEEQYGIKEEN